MRVHDEDDPRFGAEAVHDLLAGRRIEHEMLTHPPTFRAVDEARAVGVPPAGVAKTLVAVDQERCWLVVIPASRRLDLDRLRVLVGASRHLRLADEDEIARRFAEFDVGAVPPIGAALGVPEIIDTHVLDHEQVVCGGGDHRHAVRMPVRALMAVGGATVGDVCAAPDGGRRTRFSEAPLH